jgi:predicted dehydrogenase
MTRADPTPAGFRPAPERGIPEIGVGLLGYAFMGKAHSNALRTLSYMIDPPPAIPRLVALAGRDEAAVAAAAARYGWEGYYTDWRQLVADPHIQLFDNGGPNDVHLEPCLAAAAQGKHVLCEKPLARTAAEARQLLDAVRRAGVKHMVAHNYRFVPAIRHAYELIRAGALGEIRHFRAAYLQDWLADPEAPWTWRLDKGAAGAGALGDLGSHVVDLARFLVGEPRSVMAYLRTFTTERPRRDGRGRGRVDVDDAFVGALEFESGALGTLEATRVALGRRNHLELEVNGSRGSLRFNLERLNELEVYTPETGGFADVLVTERDHPFMGHWWPPGHIIGWEHTFVHELAHLLDAIANDRDVAPYGATFEDGYRAAVIGDALARSAEEGARVAIAY